MHQYTLEQVNQLSLAEFVDIFGAIFEDTPNIAADTWNHRPFRSLKILHQVMCRIVDSRDRTCQIQLLRSHPDLGSKFKMAPTSVQEQASLGLDRLTEAEFNRLQDLNQAYQDRFGFPFIVAVRDYKTKTDLLQVFEARTLNTPEQEYKTALAEVAQIAWYRLTDITTESQLP
ncbi:MAG: 2-oxo-4-hydroxy-4-carboxy-5-ureidoimidazoline decarboxylase [Leptolyngbya sp. SIO1D8]|nr:2-oxo-4-hydroxy-4-carboxy-5-ureidoimidazoline decarboxylase [Leptolyngbya sp. SIO1D8]